MSTTLRLLRLLAVSGLSFGLGYGLCWQQKNPHLRTAARVNGEAISAGELQVELQKRFGGDVLRDLVHQRLILQEARKQNIQLDSKALEARLQELKSQPETQAHLKSGQTTEADLKRNLGILLPLDILVGSRLSPQEEQDYFKRHQDEMESLTVEHILLLDPSEAEKVCTEARQPKADFAALAKKYSLDSRTRSQGGMLGEVHRGELEPDVAEVLFSLKPGQVSRPIQGEDGLHLFRVVAARTGFKELQPEIRERLISARRGDYLEELRAGAKIETIPPYRMPTSLSSE